MFSSEVQLNVTSLSTHNMQMGEHVYTHDVSGS